METVKKRSVRDWMILCSLGSAFVALGTVGRGLVENYITLPDAAFSIFPVIGVLLILVGVAGAIRSMIIGQIDRTVSDVILKGLNRRFECSFCKQNELGELNSFYRRYFGDDVPSIEVMRAWISKCESSFVLVHRVTEESGVTMRRELVGSFKILPLNKNGVRALEASQATGSTFEADHICGPRGSPVAYYVGDVAATTIFTRGTVLRKLIEALNEYISHGTANIYARPLTDDGLRIMKKYGFTQMQNGKLPPAIGLVCKKIAVGMGRASLSFVRSKRPLRIG